MPKATGINGELNSKESIYNFIQLINIVFEFTECVDDGGLTQDEVIKHIYNTLLEHNVKIIYYCCMGRYDKEYCIRVDENILVI